MSCRTRDLVAHLGRKVRRALPACLAASAVLVLPGSDGLLAARQGGSALVIEFVNAGKPVSAPVSVASNDDWLPLGTTTITGAVTLPADTTIADGTDTAIYRDCQGELLVVPEGLDGEGVPKEDCDYDRVALFPWGQRDTLQVEVNVALALSPAELGALQVVVEEAGEPVVQARVSVFQDGMLVSNRGTGATGVALIPLEAGEYDVAVTGGGQPVRDDIDVEAESLTSCTADTGRGRLDRNDVPFSQYRPITTSRAENGYAVSAADLDGLLSVRVDSPAGITFLSFPASAAPGDTVSWSALLLATGEDEDEIEEHRGELADQIVTIDGQQYPLSQSTQWTMEARAAVSLAIGGDEPQVAFRLSFVIRETITVRRLGDEPILARAGWPVHIPGPFDGRTDTTTVTFAGSRVDVLAESSVALFFNPPLGQLGVQTVEVTEAGTTLQVPVRSIDLQMSVDEDELWRGESTPLHITASGLQGITLPAFLAVLNLTTSTITMSQGNYQFWILHPNDVGTTGTVTYDRSVRGIRRGLFTIDGILIVPQTGLSGDPANPPPAIASNEAIDIGDPPANTPAVNRTTIRSDLWDLCDRLERNIGGMRPQAASDAANTLAGTHGRLVDLEGTRLKELTAVLENGDPGSSAYADAITELIGMRARLTRLEKSPTASVAENAATLLGTLDDTLERALTDRSEHLIDVLQDGTASAADRAAAAGELIGIRDSLDTLPTDDTAAGLIESRLDEYFKGRVDELTAVVDDENATAAARTAALDELATLRETLLEYGGDPTAATTAGEPDSTTVLLGEIERRLADKIRGQLGELTSEHNDPSTSESDKADALTEMFNLWNELQGLTYGQTARRNEGDTSQDDLVDSLNEQLTNAIGQRYTELATGLGEDATAEELAAGSGELFESWQRLRALGRTDTPEYRNLESSLREIYRVRSEGLTDTLTDGDASDADRAAAARELVEINDQLETLDGARGDNAQPSVTHFENNERLGEYVRERINELNSVLDSGTSSDEDKEAAINGLRDLRDLLIDMGRQPAPPGMRGDGDLEEIDQRLLPLATESLDELGTILESPTATTDEKEAALDALEDLRDVIIDLGDETGDLLDRVNDLFQRGASQRLQELEESLDGSNNTTSLRVPAPGPAV